MSAADTPKTPNQRIEIPNWQRFQHYKDRRPLWIKHYVELLADPNYLRLTLSQRGTLSGLWLCYADARRAIPLDTAYISRKLHGRVTYETLKALNHAGFIHFVASKPLAPRYQNASVTRAGEEVEEERESQVLSPSPKSVARSDAENGESDAARATLEKLGLGRLDFAGALPDMDLDWTDFEREDDL